MQVVYKVEDKTFEIFKEVVLNNLEEDWVEKFRSYIRDSGSQLMTAGLLGFFVLLSKKANDDKIEIKAYTALLYGCIRFLEDSNLLGSIEIKNYPLETLLNNLDTRKTFLKNVLEKIAEVNKDLRKRMFFTETLMKHLTWMKNFTEAVVSRKGGSNGGSPSRSTY